MSRSTSDRRRAAWVALAGCILILAACDTRSATASGPLASLAIASQATGSAAASPTGAAAPSPTGVAHLRLVALGDSIARANACPGCTAFVDLYARDLAAATGTPVDVDNRAAVEESGLPPVEATQLLNDILSDPSVREAITNADVVIVSVGFNDTPWNRLDNPCDATSADGSVIEWHQITPACLTRVASEYKQTLDEIYTQIDELRGCFTPPGQPADFCARIGRRNTLLRLATVYDDWNSPAAALGPTEATDRAFVAAQCWVIAQHGGRCADAFEALNGSHGATDAGAFLAADHTHLNQRGHTTIAALLAALGYEPFAGPTAAP